MSLKQIAIAVDQLLNTLAGGMADETISARAWRLRLASPAWSVARYVIDTFAALLGDEGHCQSSFESELDRKQLPPEYRQSQPEGVKP